LGLTPERVRRALAFPRRGSFRAADEALQRCVYVSRRIGAAGGHRSHVRLLSAASAITRPRVSVLIPAYNSPPEIIQAVSSALAQTVADVEVIVSDDGSKTPVAESLTSVRDERLRIIRSPRNRGIAAARNVALAAAAAPLVAQLDHDDFWREDHLEWLLPALSEADVGLAYANAEVIGHPDGLDSWIAVRQPGDSLPGWLTDRSIHPVNDLSTLYRMNPIPALAVVMRTEAVRGVGGYPRGLDIATDYALYIRLRRAGWRFAYVDRRSAVYRWPKRERGASFNRRRGYRHELRLFAGLALREPTNSVIRARLVGVLKDVIATHIPASVRVWRWLHAARSQHPPPR
jgi:glycosyltransferase involved in cell wall biosynthesis